MAALVLGLRRKGLEIIANLIAYTPERREPDFFAALDCRGIVEAAMTAVRMTGIDRARFLRIIAKR
jgi:hypothetical protein